jgi:hypothetical protein
MAEIRLGDAEKIHDEAEKDQTEAEVAFDPPWMCRTRSMFPFLFFTIEHVVMNRNIICCSWLNLCNKLPSSLNSLMN